MKGCNDIVKILVERLSHDDLVIKNTFGNTPLHTAALMGYHDVTKTLVGRLQSEDMFITNEKEETPWDIAKNDEIRILLLPLTESTCIE